jgi:hypothetical protein
MKNYILLLFSIVLFQNCEAQKKIKPTKTTTSIAKKSMDSLFYFKEGENQFLKNFETNLTFKTVSEDSRCPKNTQCIWQGVAVVELELMGIYTRPRLVKLSTVNDATKGYTNSVEFNNIKISLVEVSPYPDAKIKNQKTVS